MQNKETVSTWIILRRPIRSDSEPVNRTANLNKISSHLRCSTLRFIELTFLSGRPLPSRFSSSNPYRYNLLLRWMFVRIPPDRRRTARNVFHWEFRSSMLCSEIEREDVDEWCLEKDIDYHLARHHRVNGTGKEVRQDRRHSRNRSHRCLSWVDWERCNGSTGNGWNRHNVEWHFREKPCCPFSLNLFRLHIMKSLCGSSAQIKLRLSICHILFSFRDSYRCYARATEKRKRKRWLNCAIRANFFYCRIKWAWHFKGSPLFHHLWQLDWPELVVAIRWKNPKNV